MADRKGKARAWSAKRAVFDMHRAYSGWDASDASVPIDKRHLAKAYLAGIAAVIDHTSAGDLAEPRVFESLEIQRLGMSPQAKRKGKSGEGRKS